MRFNRLKLEQITLLSAAAYVLFLGIEGELDLYIHPRYIMFTIVMSAIGLALVLADMYYSKKSKHTDRARLTLLPLLIVLVAGILLPARTLTSSTVSQRTTDSRSVITTTETQPIDSLFAGSSRGLKMIDWDRLLTTNSDPSYYVNKPARISGFVYDAGQGQNTMQLSRFVLTCCAVDAQPIGVPVQIENWQDAYYQDKWLEVEGEFRLRETSQGERLVLIPDSITEIDEPDNPYGN